MRKICLFIISLFCLVTQTRAEGELIFTAENPTISQDFDGMWNAITTEASLSLPVGWRVDRQMSAPRMIGDYSTSSTEVMYTGGTSLPGNAKNGTWNFGSSATPADRAIGGLSTTIDDGTRCVNVMTHLVNGGTEPINQLTISYDIEKYRNGSNDAGFTVQLNFSYDGINWKKAGEYFKTDFKKDNETAGADVVPISTTTVINKQLKTAIAVGGSIYLAWNISVTSGTSPNKAMGLAVDNIILTASFGEPLADTTPVDPNRSPFVASGIFLRGEVNGWEAITEWEFSNEGNGKYVLYDKELSGSFKIADSSWSSACNYGSNGSAIMGNKDYTLVLGTNDNISCGLTFDCQRIVLTMNDSQVTLFLETKKNDSPEEPSVLQTVQLMPADVTLVPKLPEKVKVLSLNNSLIHYNDQATMFNDIAAAMNKDAHWTKHTLLGKPLSTHWDEGDGLAADGNPSAKMLIRTEAWSHIILQEQSGLPRTNIEAFRSNIKQWVSYIREYCPNPNAIIIVPMNWAYSGDWTNFTDFNTMFYANYLNVARETGVTICPVGYAYQQVYDEKGVDGIASWYQDDRHPTELSTYMAACMEYGLIFGEDPATITCHPASFSDVEAEEMRSYASKALAGFRNIVDHTAATIRFSAVAFDQYGKEMNSPTDFSFSLNDGGLIDDNHVFQSNKKEGIFTISAENGQFSTQATVNVTHAETDMTVFPAIDMNESILSVEENFDTIGTAADATLPEGWRIDRQTSAPRSVGIYSSALDKTMYAGGVSLPSNAKNGLWNFGEDVSTDRAVGGISTGVADGTRCVNIYAHFMNTGRKNIENLHISYDVEKYRKGSNPAGFTVQMYYSLDGRKWISAGDDFRTTLQPDEATEGYASIPGEIIPVSAVLKTTMQPGVDFYLAWNITVSAGDAANSAMALAIDNFKLKGELPAIPTAKHYIYVIDETGYDALGLYAWGDSELFGAWPGESYTDEKIMDGNKYKVFLLDADNGSYNLIFNNWNNGKQLPDYTITADHDYYLRVTESTVTEVTSTDISGIVEHLSRQISGVYDLQGRRFKNFEIQNLNLAKGIYIIQGKKYLIR